MGTVYYVDFISQELYDKEEIQQKEKKLDPVLQRVKEKMPPEHFEMYKKTIDHWMQANFEYEMEQRNEFKT